MVGRLIQQQHVWLREQQLAQSHAALFATREVADHGFPWGQAQCICGDLKLVFTIGTCCSNNGFEFALFSSEFVKICVRLSVGRVNFFQTVFCGKHVAHTALDRLAHGLSVIEFGLLRQIANLDARHGRGFAFNLLVDTRHDFEQGGLTRTVQTQHTDLGAGEKTQGNIFQDMALRRHDLADAVHGENVLGHGVCSFGKQSIKTTIIPRTHDPCHNSLRCRRQLPQHQHFCWSRPQTYS